MDNLNEDTIKPTLNKPINAQSNNFEKNFKNIMKSNAPDVRINEIDANLSEAEQSLKKKIFKLDKVEALVFSEPKLTAIYNEMAKNGEEKYGYHYNETIMNIIFNDYILNSAKYLQKYKMAIPKKKKRRDKSGINQLMKKFNKKMNENINDEPIKVMFLVNDSDDSNVYAYFPDYDYDENKKYKVAYSHIGQHSAIHPDYVKNSRPATPEEYSELKSELENLGYDLEVINPTNETTTSASSGAYSGPAVWGDGDLMKVKGNSVIKRKPIWKGGTIIQETNYLIDSSGFEKFVNIMEETKNDFNMLDEKAKSKKQQKFMGMVRAIQKGELDPKKVSPEMRKVAKNMKPSDVKDFAKTKHEGLPEKVDETKNENSIEFNVPAKQTSIEQNDQQMNETEQSIIAKPTNTMANYPIATGELGNNVPKGTQNSGGVSESNLKNDFDLLNEINNELNAYSKYHNNLKKIAEMRKPSALVLRDRLGSENEKNFKKDMKNSDTGQIIDIQKELQWKEQQTEIDDPQKLGNDIEKNVIKKTKGVAFKNVGDSTNDKGDEIPKRNLTQDEQEEVEMYRLGQESLIYDNEPSERFIERMKNDMGERLSQKREKQIKFRKNAPMYNKDTQPIETGTKKSQFDKYESEWNERKGIKESMITGRFVDALGKNRIIDFYINEVSIVDDVNNLFEINFDGLGNTYVNRTVDGNIVLNEDAIKLINTHKLYTDGKKVVAIEMNSNLNENYTENKKINADFVNKIKHLSNYDSRKFIDTKNVKIKRGF